ncbi:MAG: LysR family transcriptional regulator [Coprobacillaceae bacterium]
MSIKLEQYKIFNEAASTLSFSIASRNLFISQSAVSQAISQLEKQLHTKLFIRKSKGVVLTKEGELIHTYIKNALDLITTGEHRLSAMQELTDGRLIIASGDTICSYYLATYLEQFHTLYPKVKLEIINRTTLETIELLKSGQIDLGFINLPVNDDSLVIEECLTIHDIFVGSSKYNIDKKYSYQDISSLPLILFDENSNSRKNIEKTFLMHGIPLQPAIEVGAHDLLLQFAKINLGVSCVVKEFSKQYLDTKELVELPLQQVLPARAIGYAHIKRLPPSMATLKFLELIPNTKNI